MTEDRKSVGKVLFVGESWIKHTIHMKGMDYFTSVEYEEGAGIFLKCLKERGFEVTYVRAHEVSSKFPTTLEQLRKFDAVILSDIGSNSFLLTDETFLRSEISVNRLQLIVEYVQQGGGLLKIGGYLSFSGIDGRARYGMSPLAAIIPVQMLPYDDRIEATEGLTPEILALGHPCLGATPDKWPVLLGYNRTIPKLGSTVVARIGDDPLLVVKNEGQGRVVAFTSDVAPHWAPPVFMKWPFYATLWCALVGYATGHSNA
jgi:uncharacterized membrane protein